MFHLSLDRAVVIVGETVVLGCLVVTPCCGNTNTKQGLLCVRQWVSVSVRASVWIIGGSGDCCSCPVIANGVLNLGMAMRRGHQLQNAVGRKCDRTY